MQQLLEELQIAKQMVTVEADAAAKAATDLDEILNSKMELENSFEEEKSDLKNEIQALKNQLVEPKSAFEAQIQNEKDEKQVLDDCIFSLRLAIQTQV